MTSPCAACAEYQELERQKAVILEQAKIDQRARRERDAECLVLRAENKKMRAMLQRVLDHGDRANWFVEHEDEDLVADIKKFTPDTGPVGG